MSLSSLRALCLAGVVVAPAFFGTSVAGASAGTHWVASRSSAWTRLVSPTGRVYFLRTSGPHVSFELQQYRPSSKWHARPYLVQLPAQDTTIVEREAHNAGLVPGAAEPAEGLFVYHDGRPVTLGPEQGSKPEGGLQRVSLHRFDLIAKNGGGHAYLLSDRHKPILVVFYAPSCVACDENLRQLPEIAKQFKRETDGDTTVVVFAGADAVRGVIAKSPVPIGVVSDLQQSTRATLSMINFPSLYYVAADDVARAVWVGTIDANMSDLIATKKLK